MKERQTNKKKQQKLPLNRNFTRKGAAFLSKLHIFQCSKKRNLNAHGADVLVFLWREVKFIIMFFQKPEGKMKMDKPHQTNIIQSRGISPCQGWTGFFLFETLCFQTIGPRQTQPAVLS